MFVSALLAPRLVAAAPAQTQSTIPILQSLSPSGSSTVTVGSTVDTLPVVVYFKDAIVWIQITAAGFCVLWIVISGIQIMVSGGSNTEGAKDHLKWGLIGLIMLFFMGFILQTLNSQFYT